MEIIFESSDWHCGPDGLSEEAKEFITRGKDATATIVGCGDLFNLLPLGREKFEGSSAVKELTKIHHLIKNSVDFRGRAATPTWQGPCWGALGVFRDDVFGSGESSRHSAPLLALKRDTSPN